MFKSIFRKFKEMSEILKSSLHFKILHILWGIFLVSSTAFAQLIPLRPQQGGGLPFLFHSFAGVESQVSFEAVYLTKKSQAEKLLRIENIETRNGTFFKLTRGVLPFLMGPAIHRGVGGPKRNETITANWDSVKITGDNAYITYKYEGTWLLNKKVAKKESFELPIPLNQDVVFTKNWKACGDSEPEHQTTSFFWYFWDPKRIGCEHKVDVEFQLVHIKLGLKTTNEVETYPEYERLVRVINGKKTITMTFAFGYVEEAADPNPVTDEDTGVQQYRLFLSYVKGELPGFVERPIKKDEYASDDESFAGSQSIIGHEFSGLIGDVNYKIKVVVNAGIDQMTLFAKSFAQDHDGFFAWFGHSRVGSGFDAAQFQSILKNNHELFSITNQYQIVYWGGCNSYTYYTLPFFKFKSDLNPIEDPNGTRNLDIISNGMPSYFNLNSSNAGVVLRALLKWPKEKVTYQAMIKEIEKQSWGDIILTNVLGDEDNVKGEAAKK